jgi:hypothetical protein
VAFCPYEVIEMEETEPTAEALHAT